MNGGEHLDIWTIYYHPTLAGTFVAICSRVTDNGRREVQPTCKMATSMDELRANFQSMGLVCVLRDEKDDPSIIESWL